MLCSPMHYRYLSLNFVIVLLRNNGRFFGNLLETRQF